MRDDGVGADEHRTDGGLRRVLLGAEGWQQDRRQDEGHRDHQGQRRDEALEASCVEASEPDASHARSLTHEHRRDHESGDDEEDVHAGEATGDRQVGVVRDHREHGEGSQALDVPAMRGEQRWWGDPRIIQRRWCAHSGRSLAQYPRISMSGSGRIRCPPSARYRSRRVMNVSRKCHGRMSRKSGRDASTSSSETIGMPVPGMNRPNL